MRILYGVQGTGDGHITRARVMLPALLEQGCQVDFVFSGRAKERFFDMGLFGDYQVKKGFTFVGKGEVNWLKTIFRADIIQFYKDVKSLDISQYDLAISDFEPVTAWAAKKKGLPCIGLAHQYALSHTLPEAKIPLGFHTLLSWFAPTTYQLGVHWDHFGQVIIPPLVSVNHLTPIQEEDFILVYLPFESLENTVAWLQEQEQQRFIVYARVNTLQHYKNVMVKPLSRETFPWDLSCSQGVICHTGFGLCSEAMVLGKKILTIPIKAQMEQLSNAAILKDFQRATVLNMNNAPNEVLSQWLVSPAPPRAVFPDVANAVAKWITNGEFHQPEQLVHSLWSQVADVRL